MKNANNNPLTITLSSPDAIRFVDPQTKSQAGQAPLWGFVRAISDLIKYTKLSNDVECVKEIESFLTATEEDVDILIDAMKVVGCKVREHLSQNSMYNFNTETSESAKTYPVRFKSPISRKLLFAITIFDTVSFRAYQLREYQIISHKERAAIRDEARKLILRFLNTKHKSVKDLTFTLVDFKKNDRLAKTA